ncbi:hypothetical protein P4S65_17980 [Pseudoalteromonas sp. B131b]|uniref:hypothetical protein n=1 Tax=Pseudoalteromonas sp. B131b TaxID=630493 RepID=UPI00301E4931
MSEVLSIIGIIIVVVGGIFLLIETFRESILWGIGCILISPISLLFIVLHWDVSKKPVVIQIVGLIIMFFGASLASNV